MLHCAVKVVLVITGNNDLNNIGIPFVNNITLDAGDWKQKQVPHSTNSIMQLFLAVCCCSEHYDNRGGIRASYYGGYKNKVSLVTVAVAEVTVMMMMVSEVH